MSNNDNYLNYLKWLTENANLLESAKTKKEKVYERPGEILKKEYLEKRSITQTKLAKLVGCSHAKINEIINGKRAITVSFALDLERVLGVDAEYWLSLQLAWDLHCARKERVT